MAFSEFDKNRMEKIVGRYIEENRPPVSIRDEVDLSLKLKVNALKFLKLDLYVITPRKKYKSLSQKPFLRIAATCGKCFDRELDLKWHRFDPDPKVDPIDDFLKFVEEDQYSCFFG